MLRLAQGVHEPTHLVDAHITLGNVLFFLGELDAARRHLEQGIVFYRSLHCSHGRINSTYRVVFGLSRLAQVLWLRGYPDQALQRSQEELMLAREWSDPFHVATALVFAAEIHCRRREGQRTYAQAEAARVLADEQGFAFRLAQATMLRGWALVE
jgi:adenylate cyclase